MYEYKFYSEFERKHTGPELRRHLKKCFSKERRRRSKAEALAALAAHNSPHVFETWEERERRQWAEVHELMEEYAS